MSLLSTNTDKATKTKSYQTFKITAASSNTHLKSFVPLIDSCVQQGLILYLHNLLFQLNIINLLLKVDRLRLASPAKYCNQSV